jgi:hypothetical protein
VITFFALCAGALGAASASATITVSGGCTLPDAITAANTRAAVGGCPAGDALPATTTIALPAGTYTLAAQLEILGSARVAILGANSSDPSLTKIDAAQRSRVLMVDSGGVVSLSAVTLTGGKTADGAVGTCCSTIGYAQHSGSAGGSGGDGGGVFNSGTLTLTNAVITGNATGRGGDGGPGGHGSDPAVGGGNAGGGGYGGRGGGVFNDYHATLSLTNATVSGNQTGAGGNGGNGGSGGIATFPDGSQIGGAGGQGGGGGNGGDGGGIRDWGTLTLTNSTISANTTGDGGTAGVGGNGALAADGGNGGRINDEGSYRGSGGNGGGIYDSGLGLTLTGTTVSANTAGNGGTGGTGGGGATPHGSGGQGSRGGDGGSGGGILDGGTVTVLSATNSTITGNDAGYGGNGAAGGTGATQGGGGNGGNGGAGGGIASNQGILTNATIANNRTHVGGHSNGTFSTDGGAGVGAGIYVGGTSSGQPAFSIANTLVASNTLVGSSTVVGGPENCQDYSYARLIDGGHNLSFGDTSCPGINGDPVLGPLAANGGPTQAMALGAGSAAIDQIPTGAANCPGTDQRGQSRPYPAGGLCDIGAFEAGPSTSPDLTVSKSHTGNFAQSDTARTYTLVASNVGTAATAGTASVVDGLPTGLSATAIAGTGWSCTLATLTCTRGDALAAGGAYPAVTVTVNVAANAPASVTNTATVSGGGELNTANDTANDPTTITPTSTGPPPGNPDLTLSKSHAGSFTQGDTGRTYTVIASNGGGGPTVGTVSVVDSLPTGLSATAIAGAGWSCTLTTLTCTRGDALAAGASYPVITITVNVAANAPASVTNTATVSGGGELNTANDTASDPTSITPRAKLLGDPPIFSGVCTALRAAHAAAPSNAAISAQLHLLGCAPRTGDPPIFASICPGIRGLLAKFPSAHSLSQLLALLGCVPTAKPAPDRAPQRTHPAISAVAATAATKSASRHRRPLKFPRVCQRVLDLEARFSHAPFARQILPLLDRALARLGRVQGLNFGAACKAGHRTRTHKPHGR